MADGIGAWLARFDGALRDGEPRAVAALFEPGGYWRDLLSFTWNIVTMEGRDAITSDNVAPRRPISIRIDSFCSSDQRRRRSTTSRTSPRIPTPAASRRS